jgi:3-oxoacyl-[acyl-carrier protein] reductase
MAPSRVEARAEAVKDIPLGRVAQPQEIAAMAAFLLSGQCGSATGSVIDINGASFMR